MGASSHFASCIRSALQRNGDAAESGNRMPTGRVAKQQVGDVSRHETDDDWIRSHADFTTSTCPATTSCTTSLASATR